MLSPRTRSLLDQWAPLAFLVALAVWYLYTVPLTWISHDGLFDWDKALALNESGQLAKHGTNIVGAGFNGPFLFWLYQAVLSLAPYEATMPWVSSVLAVVALAWTAWLLWPAAAQQAALWRLALVASCPSIFEWSRLGFDYAFLPIFAPILLILRRHLHATAALWWWPLAGFVLSLALQTYIIFLPLLVLLSGDFALKAIPPRSQPAPVRLWHTAERWITFALGFVIPYIPLLVNHGLPVAPKAYGTWNETASVLFGLLAAHPQQLILRLNEDASPLLRIGLLTLGVATVATPLLALGFWRRLSSWERMLAATALATYSLIAYPDRVHYHNFVHLHLALFASLVLLGRALSYDKTRGLLILALALHVAFLVHVQRNAANSGFVTLANTFPTALAGETEIQATLRTRRHLEARLDELGLCKQMDRRLYIQGDRIVPFWEVAWKFLRDRQRHCTTTAGLRYRLHACSDVSATETRLAPLLCLDPAPEAPAIFVVEPDGVQTPLLESAAYATSLRYTPEVQQLALTVQLSAPGELVVLAGRPTYVHPSWHSSPVTTSPALPLQEEVRGYVVLQRSFTLADTAPVTVYLRSPVWDMYAEGER